MSKQPVEIDLELFELMFPGKIIGRAVVDAEARIIGVIRNVRIQIPSPMISLVVKGLNTEFTVKAENIKAIGNVVQLNITIKHSEPIEVNDIVRLRTEIQEEINHFFDLNRGRSG